MSPARTPAKAWSEMVRGNDRFVMGEPLHPRQDVERRTEIAIQQFPQAALFGCSDSRLAAEIIFDKGLGDLFVVRNAGQVISDSAIGSLEYAVSVLEVPLIVVLAHDSCGAVRAAIDTLAPEAMPLPSYMGGLVGKIVPSARAVKVAAAQNPATAGQINPAEVGLRHLRATVAGLVEASEIISEAVAQSNLAVVGCNYRLAEGHVEPHVVIGTV